MHNLKSTRSNGTRMENLQVNNLPSGCEQYLADYFLIAWQETHGTAKGQAKVLVNLNILTIILEDTFTDAEVAMAQDGKSHLLLQQYIDKLFQQIAPELITRVEKATHRPVLSNHVSSSLKSGWIMCTFKLGDKHSSN